MAEKHAKTDRSETEMDTEAGGEAGTSQLLSRHKKGHMINFYLTDSNEEIVDFVKDHEETNEHFNNKARKECLWDRFTNSGKLSVKVCKTWFESQKARYNKLTQLKSGSKRNDRKAELDSG